MASSGFLPKILYAFLFFALHATCRAHLILFSFYNLFSCGCEFRWQIFAATTFLNLVPGWWYKGIKCWRVV
jgi:hypothetical protein